jgi:amino acid adenylation domain-containing protein
MNTPDNLNNPDNQSHGHKLSHHSRAVEVKRMSASQTGRDPVSSERNTTGAPSPSEPTVLDYFKTHAQAQPEAIAIRDGSRLMTYRELDVCSNRVANNLIHGALNLEEAVVILEPASCEFLAGVLGVLKAGGTYFPMDMETPAKRLEFLLTDSKSRFVLSNEAGRNRLQDWPGKVFDLAQMIRPSEAAADNNPGTSSDPNRTAYLLYTSGSTGQPKGVQIEHHSLTNFVRHYHHRFKITPQDRSSMLAYISFDVSVSDIWPTLCAGGTVVVPPKGILGNPDGLIRWLQREEVTLSFVPTGLVEILFTRPWPKQMKLRYLITGGDRLRVRPPAGLPFTIMNGYGPTESTVFATFSVVTPEDGRGTPPPIGRPLDNVKAYVLDEKLRQLPVGESGELYLGGVQLARGYLNRPELTRERFIPDPFADKPEARMYRTGDWARWLTDGELDFLGRKDDQIQIRGHRVELGEIEAQLFAHDAVQQVCCVPQMIDDMPTGVIAHVVPKTSGQDISEILRSHLEAQLPEYMMPSQFVIHERFPLTPQGKADRAAMMTMRPKNVKPSEKSSMGGGLEDALSSLWYSLLPAAADSPKDATFAGLGGDSLLAIKLVLGVEEITGQRLEVSAFLVDLTFTGLRDAVGARMLRNEFEPVLALRKQGARPPMFCLYGHSGDIEAYFHLVKAFGDDQPVFGIRSYALEDLSRLPQSIEEAAQEVVRLIRKVQPHGVPSLVGYSWAGLLAFEVARQFASTEGVNCYTALIGTTAPMRPPNLIFRLTDFAQYFPRWLWNFFTDHKHRRWRLLRWWAMARGTRQYLANGQFPLEEVDWNSSPISRHMIGLEEKYRPLQIWDISVDVFRERDEFNFWSHPFRTAPTDYLPDGGWNRWTHQPNRIHWLEGDHVTVIKPPLVSDLAQAIRAAMDQCLKLPSSQDG